MNQGLDVEEINLAATLSDLERASARMPTILSALEDSLLKLTEISDPSVRDRAYILLERLLLHCPRYGHSFVSFEESVSLPCSHPFNN